jgi:predicted RNA-binding Zn-ribbon protein involved in translation (DUF1610 family)
MAKKITIHCEHCGEILSFNKELSVQHCSKCGKPIILCDLCPNYGKDIDCSPCPLLILKKLELKEFTYNMTITEFADYLNRLSPEELKKGVFFKDKYPLDEDIFSTLFIKYVKELGGIICYEEENDECTAYFFKTNLKNEREFSKRLVHEMIYKIVGEEWKEIIIVKQPK